MTTGIATGTTAGFFDLWRWDLRQLVRRPLLWCVHAALAVAFVLGAYSGAAQHRAQSAAMSQAGIDDAAWLDGLRARAQRDARQAEKPLPYWQDATDIAGFSRYMLRTQAMKPHLPASPLSLGDSDLLPTRLPIKLETPFAIESTYDFEPPRALALGRFDLGFAIVYLLPMALILLAALLATFERDHGMLRLIAAQSGYPRRWLGARMAAIATLSLPLACVSVALALMLAGVPWSTAGGEIAMALLLVAAYAAFWLALAFLVLAAWPGAGSALASLVGLWAVLCIGAPLLLGVASEALAPTPSRILQVDAQRRVNDAVAAERDRIVSAAFATRADLAASMDKVGSIDYATRLTFLAPEIERRLVDWQRRFDANRAARAQHAALAAYAAPPLGMDAALGVLAGTDAARHRNFEAQATAYQHRLRQFFYTRIHDEIARPTPRPPGSYARMNFTDFDAIPKFAMRDAGPSSRIAAALPTLAWLSALAALLSLFAAWRLRRWPLEM